MTVGEGWVNDPRQAYNFSKAGITPKDTGELEGMHGEGVAGAQPGLSGGVWDGLRAAMSPGGSRGSGGDEAPGASLVRRITSTPANAAAHGLIASPEDVAARSAILQRQAQAPRPAYQQELEREDIAARSGQAVQTLKESLMGRQRDVADFESETKAERENLPWAAHNRYRTQQDLLERTGAQNVPAILKSEADQYIAELQAQVKAGQISQAQAAAEMKSLNDLMESGVKAQVGGAGNEAGFTPAVMQALRKLIESGGR
jgi:hypothetical protein